MWLGHSARLWGRSATGPQLNVESMNEEEYMTLEGKSTRRGFLKQAGLVTGGAALTGSVLGSLGASAADAAPVAWDKTADVVILGGRRSRTRGRR